MVAFLPFTVLSTVTFQVFWRFSSLTCPKFNSPSKFLVNFPSPSSTITKSFEFFTLRPHFKSTPITIDTFPLPAANQKNLFATCSPVFHSQVALRTGKFVSFSSFVLINCIAKKKVQRICREEEKNRKKAADGGWHTWRTRKKEIKNSVFSRKGNSLIREKVKKRKFSPLAASSLIEGKFSSVGRSFERKIVTCRFLWTVLAHLWALLFLF